MEQIFYNKKNGRYCLINISDLIDIALVISLKSSKEEILDFYSDIFPSDLSMLDIEYYFDDCIELDEYSKKIMMDKLEYLIDLLKARKKWIIAE